MHTFSAKISKIAFLQFRSFAKLFAEMSQCIGNLQISVARVYAADVSYNLQILAVFAAQRCASRFSVEKREQPRSCDLNLSKPSKPVLQEPSFFFILLSLSHTSFSLSRSLLPYIPYPELKIAKKD
jgi:hypothetical protein